MKRTMSYHSQHGIVLVEFAMIGLLFFILLFAGIECARLAYTWTALTEATRLGARAAAVCGVNQATIKSVAQFNDGNLLPGDFNGNTNITIRYLDINGNVLANPAGADYNNIRFVETRIDNYQYSFLVPGFGSIPLGPFSSVRPREALGVVPLEGSNIC